MDHIFLNHEVLQFLTTSIILKYAIKQKLTIEQVAVYTDYTSNIYLLRFHWLQQKSSPGREHSLVSVDYQKQRSPNKVQNEK